MAIGRVKDRPDFSTRQGGKLPAAPAAVVQLRDLDEIRTMWGVHHVRVYAAVREGLLRAYGRPGRQKYYSEAELTAAFGQPLNPRDPEDQLTFSYTRAA